MYYTMVLMAATLLFWRESPIGLTAVALMSGGDGLADLVGRQFGTAKLPHNPQKSWAGSLAMFLGEHSKCKRKVCDDMVWCSEQGWGMGQ